MHFSRVLKTGHDTERILNMLTLKTAKARGLQNIVRRLPPLQGFALLLIAQLNNIAPGTQHILAGSLIKRPALDQPVDPIFRIQQGNILLEGVDPNDIHQAVNGGAFYIQDLLVIAVFLQHQIMEDA